MPAIFRDDRLGVSVAKNKERIIIDFSSPNVAKPMHVGHIRSTILGDCLARMARFLGHEVITDNHIGDWGTQFGKVIYGWKHFLDETALENNAIAELVRLYRKVNALEETDDAIREGCAGRARQAAAGGSRKTGQSGGAPSSYPGGSFRSCMSFLGIHFDERLGRKLLQRRFGAALRQIGGRREWLR